MKTPEQIPRRNCLICYDSNHQNIFAGIDFGIEHTLAQCYGSAERNRFSASETSLGTFSGAKPTEYLPWFKENFLEFAFDIAEAVEQGKRLMLLFH